MRLVGVPLLTLAATASAAADAWDCQEGWLTSLGAKKSAAKKDSLEACQAACADKSDCQAASWHTQGGGYCNLRTGNFTHADFLSTNKSLAFDANHVTCYRGSAQGPQVPHPLPDGKWRRFPYGAKAIYTAEDGLPDYDWTVGGQQSESCPAAYRVNCTAKGGDTDSDFCKCGAPPGTSGQCSECFLLGALPAAPLTKEFHAGTTTTRRQIIERALGWVANGYTYDHNDEHKVGAPEGCSQGDGPSCPAYDYVSVCQGLVHMAWGGTRLNVTAIDCLDIQPGDHIHRGGHQQLFRRWVNGSGHGNQWIVYQMGGGWGKSNAAYGKYSTSGAYGVKGCFRRNGIVEE